MSSHIYHGPWVNWAHGNLITGATLTLSDRNGGLLTSFIATFVALVGVQLWKILAFTIHQTRSTAGHVDGLYHQQQALWRNTSAPGGAAWTLLQQMWFWRNKAERAFFRTFSWALFATVYLVIFGIAAVFSSEISKSPGAQRLLVGDSCGYWRIDPTSPDAGKALSARNANESQRAATYARACYGGMDNNLQCSRYTQKALQWTYNKNASCPFPHGMCVEGDTAAFQMTTEMIDSRYNLGINTPDKDRVQLQKRTTCAPLRQRGYLALTTVMVDDGNDNGTMIPNYWVEARYGPYVDSTGTVLNYTERVATHGYNDGIGYQLSAAESWANRSTVVGWQPIQNLSLETADTVLLFLRMNAMRFVNPCDDPWFAAHYLPESNPNITWYGSDEWINTLGCAEDYRLCNPNNGKCTEYLGSVQQSQALANMTSKPTHIGLSDMQNMVAIRINYALAYSGFNFMTYSRGATALRAQETVSQLDQEDLPVDQWHTEVSSWFDGGLASIQQRIVEYATGPATIESGANLWYPGTAPNHTAFEAVASKYLCYSQLVNDSNETMSFSVLGMAILFTVGGMILILSLVIDRIVGLIQHRFNLNPHGRRAWALDDKLQLQRTVFEKSGMGRWCDADDDAVPVTIEKDKFPRFSNDTLLGPNSPDGPVEHDHNQGNGHGRSNSHGVAEVYYSQPTEYLGPYEKVQGVNVQTYSQPTYQSQHYHQQ